MQATCHLIMLPIFPTYSQYHSGIQIDRYLHTLIYFRLHWLGYVIRNYLLLIKNDGVDSHQSHCK